MPERMSLTGPTLPTLAIHQVGSYLGYTGRDADLLQRAVRDAKARSGIIVPMREQMLTTSRLFDPDYPGEKQHNEVAVDRASFATKSRADFKCDTSSATKAEGMCASRRKVYYSTAHERTTIIYPDDNRFAVTDVRYANLCSERESSMCGC